MICGEESLKVLPALFPEDFTKQWSRKFHTEILIFSFVPALQNQENKSKAHGDDGTFQLILKAVSMIGTRAWHLETVLQLKNLPTGSLSIMKCLCIKVTASIRAVAPGLQWRTNSLFLFPLSLRPSFLWWHSSSPAVGWCCSYSYPLPSRRRCGGGASTNQNRGAALRRIQRFLRGTEASDGGEVTSDETSSTPDYLDSLGATKPQPGGDGVKEKWTHFKDNTDEVNKSQETQLRE